MVSLTRASLVLKSENSENSLTPQSLAMSLVEKPLLDGFSAPSLIVAKISDSLNCSLIY